MYSEREQSNQVTADPRGCFILVLWCWGSNKSLKHAREALYPELHPQPLKEGSLKICWTQLQSESCPHPTVGRGIASNTLWLVRRWISFFLFFLWYWGLNTGLTPWATLLALVCDGFFRDRVSQTVFSGWLCTTILLISVSWVAWSTGTWP
jgi:hypothetical protein